MEVGILLDILQVFPKFRMCRAVVHSRFSFRQLKLRNYVEKILPVIYTLHGFSYRQRKCMPFLTLKNEMLNQLCPDVNRSETCSVADNRSDQYVLVLLNYIWNFQKLAYARFLTFLINIPFNLSLCLPYLWSGYFHGHF